MKKKNIAIYIMVAIISVFLIGCSKSCENAKNHNSKLKVIVSFNPLKEFAKAIGKDKIDIKVVIPNGTQPHDFQPKAKDLMSINDSDIFIYNGVDMEKWVDKVSENIDNSKLKMVEASKGCKIIGNDPHTWLGLTTAKIEALNIKNSLVQADSKNKEFYEKNFNDFSKEIDDLIKMFKSRFSKTHNKSFVTGHAAFGYLCRDFGLKQESVEGVFAEGQPTASKLKELVEYCRKNNVNTIFTEEMASPKVSETLAKEVNAKVQSIHTMACKEDDKNYIECMRDNLEKIYNSMK